MRSVGTETYKWRLSTLTPNNIFSTGSLVLQVGYAYTNSQDVTGTFKHQKAQLRDEGCDLGKVKDIAATNDRMRAS